MLEFLFRRALYMIPTVLVISVVSFIVIQAPPGDFVTYYVAQLEDRGQQVDQEAVAALRARYGMDDTLVVKYLKWMRNLVKGDLGLSMEWNRPVSTLIKDRLPWSVLISLVAFLLVHLIGIPIGIISATQQYSIKDYVLTFIGFIGLAVPNFLIALVLLWLYFNQSGQVMIGLFSPQFQDAPWSLDKLWDLAQHLWMPALIVGTAGTASLIRVVRANLLDELEKPYVEAARARGASERRVLYKYPVRIAMNPVASTIGWTLPELVNGELMVSLVLGIPTIAPIFLNALKSQDMYLAGSVVFILSILTVIGTLISDVILGLLDPRIRFS